MNLDQVLAGRTCNKGWSYTRVIQYEFVGAANEEIRDVQSRFSHCFTLNFKSSLIKGIALNMMFS